MLLVLPGTVSGQGVREEIEEPEPVEISIAALQGPTGFGLARILDEGAGEHRQISIDSRVLPSPNEAVSRMASGELDVALLPVNLASVIRNRDLGYQAAAVTGEGMIHLLSRDSSITQWSDLSGKHLHVAAKGATPDYLTQFILTEKELLDEVELDYSITSAAQLAQMIIAGRAEHVVVPEPFATMADMRGGDEILRALDYQEAWKEILDTGTVYPMTLMVIREGLIQEHPHAADELMEAVEQSIYWTIEHPEEASEIIEEHGILSADMARPAIPHSGLTFQEMEGYQASVEDFLQVLYQFEPSSIGGAMPDEGFYWIR